MAFILYTIPDRIVLGVDRVEHMASLILSIAHQIFLNKEQRYALAEGNPVEVIAPSVPVWFYKGSTSEPATEVFCRYLLTNNPKAPPVNFSKDGYHINVPQIPEDYKEPERIPDDVWRKMSPIEQQDWYDEHPTPPSGRNLLDVQDGGGAYLQFQHQSKIKKDGKRVELVHYIEIKDMKVLLDTLAK